MSVYTPHYEVCVRGPVVSPFESNVLAQISPTQTIEAATQAGMDLREVYGVELTHGVEMPVPGVKCYLHTCTHDEEGRAVEKCTEGELWPNE